MLQRVAVSLLLLSAGAGAQSIFVTTTTDTVDFFGSKTVADLPGPDGKISMREAALAATNTPGPQTIGFHVAVADWGTGTTGPVMINKGDPYAIGGDDTTVDGTTQTAFTGDTNPNGAEVSFHSILSDVDLIKKATFEIASDHNHFLGLGNMDGRNYGLDIMPEGEDNHVTACVIDAVFAAVRVQGDDNVIGGTAPGEGNRLSSLSDGLRIQGLGFDTAENNVAVGNFLTGEFNGVQIAGSATGNRIGGFAPGEANVISGAGYLQEDGTPDGAMVRIEIEATGNFVLGNLIGTNATGTAVADNIGDVGVEIYGDSNIVRGNVIGGITGVAGFLSVQAGVHLREGAENNIVRGNWIGVDASGTIPLPNRIGVQISAFDETLPAPGGNLIGGLGADQGNVIAFNEEGGIRVLLATTGNHLSGNELRDNHGLSGLGIDLGGDGPTRNDAGDLDTGPNELMNFPELTAVVSGAQGTVAFGKLDTAAPGAAQLELFSNPAPTGSEPVEAEILLGTASPDAAGRFAVILAGSTTGRAITATATDALGNTSELGEPVISLPTPWTDLGFSLAGAHGMPELAGGGTLVPGTPFAVVLHNALEQAPGACVFGTTQAMVPLFGGTLVPAPQVIVPFVTDNEGHAFIIGPWPLVPSGTPIFAQAGLLDPAAAFGVAQSNALRGNTQ